MPKPKRDDEGSGKNDEAEKTPRKRAPKLGNPDADPVRNPS
jgi:hypothetical protein